MAITNVDYPIHSPSCVKVSYKHSLKPSDRKDPWVYLRAPKCDLFEFTEPISEIMVVYLAGLLRHFSVGGLCQFVKNSLMPFSKMLVLVNESRSSLRATLQIS